DKTGGNTMAHIVGPDLDLKKDSSVGLAHLPRHLEASPQHFGSAPRKMVAGQGKRIARNATLAGSDVGHCAGGSQVASLALFPCATGWACQPLRVSAVNMDAENYPFMTRGTVSTVLVERGIGEGFAGAHGIIQGAEEKLIILRRSEQFQAIPAKT